MLHWTSCVFRLVDVIVFVASLSTLLVTVTACPGSEEDSSIQTCVEDLELDVETWSTIEALRVHYEDYPTHCRYGTTHYSARLIYMHI